jgi:hypothetical protein
MSARNDAMRGGGAQAAPRDRAAARHDRQAALDVGTHQVGVGHGAREVAHARR